MATEDRVFERIVAVRAPRTVVSLDATYKSPAFDIEFDADGRMPFAQVVVWCAGRSYVVPASSMPGSFIMV